MVGLHPSKEGAVDLRCELPDALDEAIRLSELPHLHAVQGADLTGGRELLNVARTLGQGEKCRELGHERWYALDDRAGYVGGCPHVEQAGIVAKSRCHGDGLVGQPETP
jgi:hypothetical protein